MLTVPRVIATFFLVATTSTLTLLSSMPLLAAPPTWIYRADVLPPSEVFTEGFSSEGTLQSLLAHFFTDSCAAAEPVQRSAWLTASGNRRKILDFVKHQLLMRPLPPEVARIGGVWVYTIRTDDRFLEVADIFAQVRQAGLNRQAPYNPSHAAMVDQILAARSFAREAIVVTRRIPPSNIHQATLVVLNENGEPTNAQAPLLNADYSQPGSSITNQVSSLQLLVPPQALLSYTSLATQTCTQDCSSERGERKRRSADGSGLYCESSPSAAEALLGSED